MLLDRLFSLLSPEEITAVLRGFGWSIQDYQRGYILKVCIVCTYMYGMAWYGMVWYGIVCMV